MIGARGKVFPDLSPCHAFIVAGITLLPWPFQLLTDRLDTACDLFKFTPLHPVPAVQHFANTPKFLRKSLESKFSVSNIQAYPKLGIGWSPVNAGPGMAIKIRVDAKPAVACIRHRTIHALIGLLLVGRRDYLRSECTHRGQTRLMLFQ